MADQVQLGVMLTGAEQAIANLAQIDAYVKGLNGKNIKIAVSSTGITRAANQAEKLNTNLTSASASAQKIGTAAPQAMQKTAKATETAAGNAQKLSLGFGSIAANLLKFQAVNLVINGTAKAFKFAFQEMKNVDTEMVNIRKVTGFSADEMERLEKSAYSLASKYGRTASEVLEGGTTFARAGYTDQIEQLSELSLLLQNVGDLQADDASKFIVATDKAYKLGGSYKDLMAIIDGLDNITNKNATDMQKMTDGMTIAGSVFAESGESIETFAALLGTATANTQRSGSEVARGLRTILMNLRQIRGETEDGELIDGESIAAASKALKDYANISTMENGQLRKASDVLTELAGKWDTLTETQRAAIAEAVAGKRQANILMSLMGDWESVTKMMQEYENSAGTAAKENAAYMDSWQAKTEQVKASWTELVNSFADTDIIKGTLDFIITGLQSMNDLMANGQGADTDLEGREYSAIGKSNSLMSGLQSATRQFGRDQDAEALAASLRDAAAAGQEFYDSLQRIKQEGQEWTYQETNFAAAFEALQTGLENGQSAFDLYGYAVAASLLAAGNSAEDSADGANSAVDELIKKLNDLPEEKNIQINVTTGIDQTLGQYLEGFASGTRNAPGGPALVNENGPEMIAANGLAWIAGGGKPTVTMLPRGAQVFTAQQTRQATGGKGFSGIPAYADGTAGNREYRRLTADDLYDSTPSTISGNTGSKYKVKYCPVCGTPNPVHGKRCVACGFNFEAAEQKERDEANGGGNGQGGSSGSSVPDFKALEKELSDRLKNLDLQAKLAENEEDFLKAMEIYGDAQDYIAELLDKYRAAGYAEDSDEVLKLANMGYEYAAKQLGGYDDLQSKLIDALNALTDATEDATALQERREAVDKAREALANAEKQRTVRIFNPVTGQWEWVANAADVQKAQENLRNAEDSLQKEELAQAINAIKNANPEDLANMTIGPAILDKLFGGTPEQQSAFLNALNGAYGGASYLGSAAAQTAFNQGNTIGTQYNLNGINITPEQAATMTIKDLLNMLQGLKIM